MPPPGYEPFLRAICENPEDDTVRLVYADWLDENGDPERAEFIRLQIACPGQPAEFDPRYARMEELRKLHGSKWRAELPRMAGITYGQFRRGFIDRVTFQHFRVFAKQSDALLSLIPACDNHLVQVQARDVSALLDNPHTRRLSLLRVNAGIDAERVIERLAGTAWEWKLTELDISGWGPNASHPFTPRPMITDRGATLLLRSEAFPKLRALRLAGVSLSQVVYESLAERFGRGLWTYPRMSS